MKAKCSLGLNTIEDLWCRNCLLPMTGYETIFYWWIPMVPATLNACQCPPPGIDVPWTWYLAGKPISDQWCLVPWVEWWVDCQAPGYGIMWDTFSSCSCLPICFPICGLATLQVVYSTLRYIPKGCSSFSPWIGNVHLRKYVSTPFTCEDTWKSMHAHFHPLNI